MWFITTSCWTNYWTSNLLVFAIFLFWEIRSIRKIQSNLYKKLFANEQHVWLTINKHFSRNILKPKYSNMKLKSEIHQWLANSHVIYSLACIVVFGVNLWAKTLTLMLKLKLNKTGILCGWSFTSQACIQMNASRPLLFRNSIIGASIWKLSLLSKQVFTVSLQWFQLFLIHIFYEWSKKQIIEYFSIFITLLYL